MMNNIGEHTQNEAARIIEQKLSNSTDSPDAYRHFKMAHFYPVLPFEYILQGSSVGKQDPLFTHRFVSNRKSYMLSLSLFSNVIAST